jgi:hypothetical protein
VLLFTMAPPTCAEEPSLEQRLGPDLARRVEDIVHTARAESLPTATLVATALEGMTKHVPPERIVVALERHLGSLRAARAALGPAVGDPELVAAAAALRAGIASDSLSSLRAARPGQSLLVPLVVLGDMIARRVPPDASGAFVNSLVRAGASDIELMKVREGIDADIRKGVTPMESAGVRARVLLRSLPARGVPPEPRVPVRGSGARP